MVLRGVGRSTENGLRAGRLPRASLLTTKVNKDTLKRPEDKVKRKTFIRRNQIKMKKLLKKKVKQFTIKIIKHNFKTQKMGVTDYVTYTVTIKNFGQDVEIIKNGLTYVGED